MSDLKWTGMGEFNSDGHNIYYCGQESLRRNGVTLIVNKRVWNAVLGYNLKNDRMISVHFQDKPSNFTICCCSFAKLCPTLCSLMDCSMPGFPVLHYLLELAQTHVHWVSDAIQPSHPLSPPSPLALSLSQHQGLFQWVSSLHQVPKYWSFFFFSLLPSNDLLTVQGTLKSLLQHHNLKASVLQRLTFFMVKLSHLYMITGKTIRWDPGELSNDIMVKVFT